MPSSRVFNRFGRSNDAVGVGGTLCHGHGQPKGIYRKKSLNLRAWRHVQIANCTDTVQAILQRSKRRRLRKKHEEAVKAFVEVGKLFGFKELESKV